MKMNLHIVALIFLLILQTSCEKQRGTFTQVKGKVLEHGSGIPVKNALVKFVRLDLYTLNTIENLLDTVRTDLNGNYSFSLNTEGGDLTLLVYAESEGYFSHEIHNGVIGRPDANVIRGINQYVDIHIIPFSWVRIKADNSLGNDYAWINRVMGSNSSFGFEIWEGMEKTRRTFGNYEVEVNSFLLKNNTLMGKTPYFIQTTAGDTTNIVIHY